MDKIQTKSELFEKLNEVIEAVDLFLSHIEIPQGDSFAPPYCVIDYQQENLFFADNVAFVASVVGEVTYFCNEVDDPNIDAIRAVLSNGEILTSFRQEFDSELRCYINIFGIEF